MVKSPTSQKLANEEDIFVHSSHRSVRELPTEAILFPLLKKFESELQNRGMLPDTSQSDFFPIWFLAETERNVALWRLGLSLSYAEDFEFWISVEMLIEKRLMKLTSPDRENPFHGGFSKDLRFEDHLSQSEEEYIFQFRTLYTELATDFHALSVATSIAARELGEEELPLLLLPLPLQRVTL
ncbi:MAG: hypothetical protein KDD64_10565 [Bdellovibrionales bacterium]|nr:hypothetical protein [Bdellovibrionales bacterium]